MRLTRHAALQLTPLVPTGELRFEYHGTPRSGVLETLGEGPAGAFLLIRHADGSCKSYSLAKMRGLRAVPEETLTTPGDDEPSAWGVAA